MANDSKYGRLYPERVIAPLRDAVRRVLEDDGTQLRPMALAELQKALRDLDRLGFPPDEPLFLLRGQDVLASEIVRAYARTVRDNGASLDLGHIEDLADRMEAWEPRKLPD